MAFEQLKASIALILDEIAARPEDRYVLQERLREKLRELEAAGHPVPPEFEQFCDRIEGDSEDEDFFDNMPV